MSPDRKIDQSEREVILKMHLILYAFEALKTGYAELEFPEEVQPKSPDLGRERLLSFLEENGLRKALSVVSVTTGETGETKYKFQRIEN